MTNIPTSPGDGSAQGADPAELALFCPAALDAAGTSGLQVAIAPDGRRAVLAYTLLDDLLAGCGQQAGWVQLTALGLRRLVAERDEVDTVWLDPARPVARAPRPDAPLRGPDGQGGRRRPAARGGAGAGPRPRAPGAAGWAPPGGLA